MELATVGPNVALVLRVCETPFLSMGGVVCIVRRHIAVDDAPN